MASRRDLLRAPRETSTNRRCPPRKENRSLSGRCARREASSQTYCQPEKREGLMKIRATTSSVFWAVGNRRSGACADSRVHCLREPLETQRSYHQILSILTLCRVSQIILNEHSRKRCIRWRAIRGGSALLLLVLIFRRGNRRRSHRDSRGGSFGFLLLGLAQPLNFYAGDAASVHLHHGEAVNAKFETLAAAR